MVELALVNGEYNERIPGTRIFQISFRKVSIAVRVRMENADEVHAPTSSFPISLEQIFRTQFVAFMLDSGKCVFNGKAHFDSLHVAINGAKHGPAAFVRVNGLGMGHHGLPRF